MRVEARDVSKRFGRVCALRGVSFEIPAGRRVALVGPNGSGKSTLNRALLGLLRCGGEVLLDGMSPHRERSAVAQRLAYVPQVAPNLAVPVRELLRAVQDLRGLAPAEVAKVASRFDLDLATVARRPFRALSGGMRQKLLVSIALASRASLLVLDEPTGSLDARSREAFFGLFGQVTGETTLLLCSHRLEEVRALVDHVLLLEEGRIAWDGAVGEFLARSAATLIEVCAAGGDAAHWLCGRGFRQGAGGWWVRRARSDEKLALLPELAGQLGGALTDLNVRDLESLEAEAAPAADLDGD